MLGILISIAVILYGVYLFKKIKQLKQEKNKKSTCTNADEQVGSPKVENDEK